MVTLSLCARSVGLRSYLVFNLTKAFPVYAQDYVLGRILSSLDVHYISLDLPFLRETSSFAQQEGITMDQCITFDTPSRMGQALQALFTGQLRIALR